MKNRVLTFAFLLLGTLAFVSCQKINPEDGLIDSATDELAYLQGHFASIDDEGVRNIWAGWQLNEADPGELSMKADSYEAAAAIFKKIILPDANVEETESSLIWHLAGEDGKSQGDAVLSKASGDKVAVLTLPAAATLVNRVNFIPHSLWPENGEQEYREELDDFFFCNLVKVKVNLTQNPGSIFCRGNHGTGEFLVIQEYDQETNTWGYLLRLPDKTYSNVSDNEECQKRAPSLEAFQEVRKIYFDNQELLDKEMEKAGFAKDKLLFVVRKKDNWCTTYGWKNGKENPLIVFFQECLVYRFGFGTSNQNGTTTYSNYLIVQ